MGRRCLGLAPQASKREERQNEAPDGREDDEAATMVERGCAHVEDLGAGEQEDERDRPQAQAYRERYAPESDCTWRKACRFAVEEKAITADRRIVSVCWLVRLRTSMRLGVFANRLNLLDFSSRAVSK
jgi:hypothetical protein